MQNSIYDGKHYDLMTRVPLATALVAAAGLGSTIMSLPAHAQEPDQRAGSAAIFEEITVTARKREESAQDVPLSITAYGAEQLEALKIRDLTDFSIGTPNVTLEEVGTVKGTATFSIRGLSNVSSIPSIEPTVGVFSNDVYHGITWGVVFDMFDIETIEVLRGPQGTLFGRNTTGGAVLINHKKPGDSFEFSARTALEMGDEGGVEGVLSAAVAGPVTDTLSGRLVLYYNDDQGGLENDFTGNDAGALEQELVRGTLVWGPSDLTELTLRYEYNASDGDGPQAQSHTNGLGVPGTPVNNDRDSWDYSIDEEGFQETETHAFTAELNHDVDFGDGTITGIFGYRAFESEALSDIDAQPVWLFHVPSWLDQEQTSFELRYNGVFNDRTNVTTGVYIFDQELDYHERRELLGVATGGVAPALTQDAGGNYDAESFSAFAQVDHDLTDNWTLTAGLNYTSEEKDVAIASLGANTNAPCNSVNGPACVVDFQDDESWSYLAPKVGLTYYLDDAKSVYAHWTRGFRSGSYNLRNSVPGVAPGPFDEETVDNFEIGYKSSQDWGRLNAAVFYMKIEDQQREPNIPDPTFGVVQLFRNTADSTIAGFEIEGTFRLSDNLLLLASVGYLDASYDKVLFDLNGDGVVDELDESLELPLVPELTWSLGLSHDLDLGEWGYMTSRVNYSFRDEMKTSDNNLSFLNELKLLDAGLDFHSNDGRWVFSLYGRNLTDEVRFGSNDTVLPTNLGGVAPLGGTFAPLATTGGRRYGIEVRYEFF